MANSPLVSVRIPPEMLERLDQLAQKLYPPRRAGKAPNRSQVILDAINLFLEQHETDLVSAIEPAQEIKSELAQGETITESIDEEFIKNVPLEYPEYLSIYSKYSDPSVRRYIDWWLDYFTYLKKISDNWLDPKP